MANRTALRNSRRLPSAFQGPLAYCGSNRRFLTHPPTVVFATPTSRPALCPPRHGIWIRFEVDAPA
jgi:hypothetical protein